MTRRLNVRFQRMARSLGILIYLQGSLVLAQDNPEVGVNDFLINIESEFLNPLALTHNSIANEYFVVSYSVFHSQLVGQALDSMGGPLGSPIPLGAIDFNNDLQVTYDSVNRNYLVTGRLGRP